VNPFTAADAGIDVSLGPDEQVLLSQLLTLLGSVGASPDDPAADRLDPDAYRDDVDASHEFRRLTASELTTARDMDREVFAATLPSSHLSVEEAEAWVRVIGDARLAIAARRGVVEGDTEWESEIDQNPDLAVVAYLGFLQARLVEALLELEAAA
jgi:hypothetical protein